MAQPAETVDRGPRVSLHQPRRERMEENMVFGMQRSSSKSGMERNQPRTTAAAVVGLRVTVWI